MRAVYLHEVDSAFTNLTAYVFSAFLLLFGGIYTMAYNINMRLANFEYVLQSMSFLFIIIIPVVTMRSLAEERRQKTEQLLYALPLSMAQVVIGKYLALLTQFLLPVAVLGLYPLVLQGFGQVPMAAAFASLTGFFFLGAALLAMGLFISSVTESQSVAAGLCFVVMLLNYFLESLAQLVPGTAIASLAAFAVVIAALGFAVYRWTKHGVFAAVLTMLALAGNLLVYAFHSTAFEGLFASVIEKLSLFSRFYIFITGVFDWTAVVYDLTVIALFLVFTVETMEKRRWSE